LNSDNNQDRQTLESGPAELRLSWLATDVDLPAVRHTVRTWIQRQGQTPRDLSADVELAVTELLTNARSACASPNGRVSLHVTREHQRVVVTVTNAGAPFEPQVQMPGASTVSGRGLTIVAALGDLAVDHRAGTTTVTVRIAEPEAARQ